MAQVFGAFFSQNELSLFKIREKITSIQTLHDDVDVVLVFKNIKQTDYMRMLAHFKNFDLTSLQLNITCSHLFLGHYLYSNIFTGLFVDCGLYKTELTFTQSVLDIIEVKQVTVTN